MLGQVNLARTLDVLLDPLDVQILHVQSDADGQMKISRFGPAYIDLLSRAAAIGTDSVHTHLALNTRVALSCYLLHVVDCVVAKMTTIVWKLSDHVVI